MASLFIKDAETAALAAELARRLGKTKTEIVRNALMAEARMLEKDVPTMRWSQKLALWRRDNPLPPHTGFIADKTFYDSLNDD
jgi:antitoxin VapB